MSSTGCSPRSPSSRRLEPNPGALRAHLEEGTAGEPITDPARLAELFWLACSRRSGIATGRFPPSPRRRRFGSTRREPRRGGWTSVEPFTEAVRKGASEFALLTPVKARPVLVITAILPEYDEVLALRLRRFEKLSSDAERERVREGADPGLFPLRPDR